jgi:hypothetical protein
MGFLADISGSTLMDKACMQMCDSLHEVYTIPLAYAHRFNEAKEWKMYMRA